MSSLSTAQIMARLAAKIAAAQAAATGVTGAISFTIADEDCGCTSVSPCGDIPSSVGCAPPKFCNPTDFAGLFPDLIGPTGATGVMGPSGVTGATGNQGTTGPTGIAGPTGVSGVQGVTGPTGPNGSTGIQGIKGESGATGSTGIQGITGPTGASGLQGLVGVTGVSGVQGVTGPTGPSGLQGLVGETGVQGPTGIQGATGATGLQGATGIGASGGIGGPGATGATGIQGIQGTTGPTGASGLQGLVGETGSTGPVGSTGVAGSPGGATGPTGVVGPAGVPITGYGAPTGVSGAFVDQLYINFAVGNADVYQWNGTGWVIVGNILGLPGSSGSTGPVGATGSTGPIGLPGTPGGATGSTGPVGATGIQGDPGGATGPTGPQGTPGGATGPQGPTGANGAVGGTGPTGSSLPVIVNPGVPSPATGVEGQLYINSLAGNSDMYQKTGGFWIIVNNILGSVGPTGATGIQGATGVGVAGSVGSTGATGIQGLVGTTGPTGVQGSTGVSGITTLVLGRTVYVDKTAEQATDTRTGLSAYDFTRPFVTLSAAITAAVSGDTIIVRSGAYTTGTVTKVGGGLKIVYESGCSDTFNWQCQGGVTVVNGTNTILNVSSLISSNNGGGATASIYFFGLTVNHSGNLITCPAGYVSLAAYFTDCTLTATSTYAVYNSGTLGVVQFNRCVVGGSTALAFNIDNASTVISAYFTLFSHLGGFIGVNTVATSLTLQDSRMASTSADAFVTYTGGTLAVNILTSATVSFLTTFTGITITGGPLTIIN